jgi:hypothetical protein
MATASTAFNRSHGGRNGRLEAAGMIPIARLEMIERLKCLLLSTPIASFDCWP